MDISVIFLWSILLFFIITIAVRLAINPLLNKEDEIISESEDSGLAKLRDIGVLNNSELEEIIKLYQSNKNRNYEQYEKYERVIKELKEIGYFSDKQYSNKMNKLNNYFKID